MKTRKKGAMLLGIVCLSALSAIGCASVARVDPESLSALSSPAKYIAVEIAPEAEDRQSVEEGVRSLLTAIARRYGPDAARDLMKLSTSEDLRSYLAAAHGTTAYEETLTAFIRWNRESKAPAWNEKKLDRLETEHFVIVSLPGTPGYRDRGYLARLLERQLTEIENFMLPDEGMKKRFRANMDSLAGGRVEVIVPPNSKSFSQFGDTSNMNWGFSLKDDRLDIVASIRLPYYNALSASILAHEETHLLDIFYKLDLSAAPPLPQNDGDRKAYIEALGAWARDVFSRIFPNDTGFGEGFAEYVAAQLSPIHKVFIGNPDDALAVMHRRIPSIDDILAASPSVKDRTVRIVRYTELHSFVRYLMDAYGRERFLDFYMEVPLSEDKFRQVYGKDFRAMESEWRAVLDSRAAS